VSVVNLARLPVAAVGEFMMKPAFSSLLLSSLADELQNI
jgi:hypothetical protein